MLGSCLPSADGKAVRGLGLGIYKPRTPPTPQTDCPTGSIRHLAHTLPLDSVPGTAGLLPAICQLSQACEHLCPPQCALPPWPGQHAEVAECLPWLPRSPTPKCSPARTPHAARQPLHVGPWARSIAIRRELVAMPLQRPLQTRKSETQGLGAQPAALTSPRVMLMRPIWRSTTPRQSPGM